MRAPRPDKEAIVLWEKEGKGTGEMETYVSKAAQTPRARLDERFRHGLSKDGKLRLWLM